jgi:hypothetical protein
LRRKKGANLARLSASCMLLSAICDHTLAAAGSA